jgi:hypothetical protein
VATTKALSDRGEIYEAIAGILSREQFRKFSAYVNFRFKST